MSSHVPSPAEARKLHEQLDARVAAAAVPPPPIRMLWCVYYIEAHTALALQALDGDFQFAEHDLSERSPEPGDIAFAAWGRRQGEVVVQQAWPGTQILTMLAFGRIESVGPDRLLVRAPEVWRDVDERRLRHTITHPMFWSWRTVAYTRPLLCGHTAQPDVPPLAE